MEKKYDYRNCQSLFGYAQKVHEKSGGVCQLCNAGKGQKVDFDMWRQLTVEHIVGRSQGGDIDKIRKFVSIKFKELDDDAQEALSKEIDLANTITACSFCNSMTSRFVGKGSMKQIIMDSVGSPAEALKFIKKEIATIHKEKVREIKRKLTVIRNAYTEIILPKLRRR